MITSTTPYKVADIIRDTWPNLYRPPKDHQPPAKSYVGLQTGHCKEGAGKSFTSFSVRYTTS